MANPNFKLPDSDSAVVPVGLIGRAATTNPTNATDGVEVPIQTDKAGRIVACENATREQCLSQTSTKTADTTETTIVTAGATGVFNDLTGLIITCTGNTVIGTLTIRDATGGAAKTIVDFPPTAANPLQPIVIDFTPPLTQAAAANNWTAQLSANAGTTHILAQFIKTL